MESASGAGMFPGKMAHAGIVQLQARPAQSPRLPVEFPLLRAGTPEGLG